MKIVKYHLYVWNEDKHDYERLSNTDVCYTLDVDKIYAVRIRNTETPCYIDLPLFITSITSRDISMFMLGRRSINPTNIENLCRDVINV